MQLGWREREREKQLLAFRLYFHRYVYICVCAGFGLTSAAGPEINERKREEKGGHD
jgi:hypothetical protein